MDLGAEELVLIGGDVVHACCNGGLPALARGGEASEVVCMKPAVTAELIFGCAIESVEADPESVRVSAFYECPEAEGFPGGPFTGMLLAGGLDDAPRVVPPAAVVCGLLGVNHFWRRVVVLVGGVYRSECQDGIVGAELVIEDGLLSIGLAGQDEDGADHERLDHCGVVAFRGFRDPGAVFKEKCAHGGQVLRLVVFEIEVQSDERPIAVIPVSKGLLDDGPDAIEEVMLHGWFMAGDRVAVGDDGPAAAALRIGEPAKVLFDGNRGSSSECSIDAVVPPLVVWVAIVRIHDGASTGVSTAGRWLLSN